MQCTAGRDSRRQFPPLRSIRLAPTMFLEFAELDGSEESVLKFIDSYGRLWEDLTGPCLVDYRETIEDLGEAVELWQAIQRGDATKLRRHVFWDSAGRLRWKSDLSHPVLTGEGKTVHVIDLRQGPRDYKCGDLIRPATDLLDFVIATRPTWDMQIKPVRRNGVLGIAYRSRNAVERIVDSIRFGGGGGKGIRPMPALQSTVRIGFQSGRSGLLFRQLPREGLSAEKETGRRPPRNRASPSARSSRRRHQTSKR